MRNGGQQIRAIIFGGTFGNLELLGGRNLLRLNVYGGTMSATVGMRFIYEVKQCVVCLY